MSESLFVCTERGCTLALEHPRYVAFGCTGQKLYVGECPMHQTRILYDDPVLLAAELARIEGRA